MPYGLPSLSRYLSHPSPLICLAISSICLLHLLLSCYCRFAATADVAAAAAASVSPNFRTSQADREICPRRKFQVIRRRCRRGGGPTVAHRRSNSPKAYVSRHIFSRDRQSATRFALFYNASYGRTLALCGLFQVRQFVETNQMQGSKKF